MSKLFLNVMDRISVIAVWIGGSALLLSSFVVSVDVLLRKFAGITMAGSDEITGYVFAIATSSAIALTLREKSNIRIDLLYNLAPSKFRLFLDVLSFLAIGLLLALMFNGAMQVALDSYELGTISVTPLQTPLAVPQMLWLTGFAVALLMWLALALRLMTGGSQVIHSLIGARSLESEIEQELDALEEAASKSPSSPVDTTSMARGN
ncbi:TRAP transporter small permease [Roseovarius pacificus]|uniref:TRAP transporter small permease subunit n=1 Tax=Roseovarius pacificus TaxID=337701 RepID=UPI002A1885C2|nr:TRAP transporter small permease [Roseovarius pacificus]